MRVKTMTELNTILEKWKKVPGVVSVLQSFESEFSSEKSREGV
jgi:hypothetical protein